MTPYYADDWLTVYHGDARAVMAEMEPESVHCVVTSPPYWGLRDYGTATWVGGAESCPHRIPATGSTQNKGNNNREGKPFDVTCGLCGAVREDGQLGLEPTPEAYVESMVAVFREVRRVLRSDGTVWLNLGDSYASAPAGNTSWNHGDIFDGRNMTGHHTARRSSTVTAGLKPKDLVGIPWRVAFALQADGWYLRSDIIWSKPNPMPESVTDRPTKSHEYLFLLSKSPRYYFDADAVREDGAVSSQARAGIPRRVAPKDGLRSEGNLDGGPQVGIGTIVGEYGGNRNIRSVWTVATQPYPGAHFATFPPKLIEPCIKAGSPGAVCVVLACGAPARDGRPDCAHHWDGCEHFGGECVRPATVLDPFAGSGTTGLVAQRLSRRAVLIDISMDYLDQLMERNRDIPLGLGA